MEWEVESKSPSSSWEVDSKIPAADDQWAVESKTPVATNMARPNADNSSGVIANTLSRVSSALQPAKKWWLGSDAVGTADKDLGVGAKPGDYEPGIWPSIRDTSAKNSKLPSVESTVGAIQGSTLKTAGGMVLGGVSSDLDAANTHADFWDHQADMMEDKDTLFGRYMPEFAKKKADELRQKASTIRSNANQDKRNGEDNWRTHSRETARTMIDAGLDTLKRTQPTDPGLVEGTLLGAAESIPQLAGVAVGGMTAGLPGIIASIGATQYGGSFANVIDNPNLTKDQKQNFATASAGLAMVLNSAPAAIAMRPNQIAVQRFLRTLGVNIGSQEANAVAQQVLSQVDNVSDPISPNEWGQLVLDAGVQALMFTGAEAAVGHAKSMTPAGRRASLERDVSPENISKLRDELFPERPAEPQAEEPTQSAPVKSQELLPAHETVPEAPTGKTVVPKSEEPSVATIEQSSEDIPPTSKSDQDIHEVLQDIVSGKANTTSIDRAVDAGLAVYRKDGSAKILPAGRRMLASEPNVEATNVESEGENADLVQSNVEIRADRRRTPSGEKIFTVYVDGEPVNSYQSREAAESDIKGLSGREIEAKQSEEQGPITAIEKPEPAQEKPGIVRATVAGQLIEVNSEPTLAQKGANNYKRGHIDLHGLNIAIENPKGTTRIGADSKGNTWERELSAHYGYIKGSEGADGDHVDTFIGPKPQSKQAFVIDQLTPDGKSFDEHKVVLGVSTEHEAKSLYLKNYPSEFKGFGAITQMPVEELKQWVKSGDTKVPLSWKPEIRSVEKAGPLDKQVIEEPTSEVIGNWSHTKYGDAKATVTAIDKGFKIDFGNGDIQEFLGHTAEKKTRAELSKEGFEQKATSNSDLLKIAAEIAHIQKKSGVAEEKNKYEIADKTPTAPPKEPVIVKEMDRLLDEDLAYKDNKMILSDDGTENIARVKTRPGTTPAQADLGVAAVKSLLAIRDVRAGARVLGSGLPRDFIDRGSATLVGRVVEGPQDLARLAQVYRDPRFETLRFFFTKGDVIVEQIAITSRLPGAVAFDMQCLGEDKSFQSMRRIMMESGADAYWMQHNHPGGSANPSKADHEATAVIEKKLPGFKGHVVIDNNSYAIITIANGVTTEEIRHEELGGYITGKNPEIKHSQLNAIVKSPSSLAKIAKALEKTSDDYVIIIGVDNAGKTRVITQYPKELLHQPGLKPVARLRRLAIGTGSRSLFAVTSDYWPLSKLLETGVLSDAIQWPDAHSGSFLETTNDFELHPNRELISTGLGREEIKSYRVEEQRSGYQFESGKKNVINDGDPSIDSSMMDDSKYSRWFNTFVVKAQDRFYDLLRLQDAAKELNGVSRIPDEMDAYGKESLWTGKAAERIDQYDKEFIKPLADLIKSSGYTWDEVEMWLLARHAMEANPVIQGIHDGDKRFHVGLSDEEARFIAQKSSEIGDIKKMREIGDLVDRMTKFERNTLVHEGLIPESVVKQWEEKYKHYVPAKGWASDPASSDKSMPRKGKGLDTGGKIGKVRIGRTTRPANILANIVAQAQSAIILSEKANVGRSLLQFLKANPAPELYEVNKLEYKPVIDKATGLAKLVAQHPLGITNKDDNVFAIKMNGLDEWVVFNKQNPVMVRLSRNLKNMGAQDLGVISKMFSTVNRWLAITRTSWNPEFVPTNALRDMETALYTISATEAKDIKFVRSKLLKSWPSAWRGIRLAEAGKDHEWAPWWKRFKNAGAKMGWLDSYKDPEQLENKLRKSVERAGLSGSLKDGIDATLDWIELQNTAVENAVRLAVFRIAIEAGITEQRAGILAKNLTVNFSRRGEWGTHLNAYKMFTNATIQGSAILLRAMKSPTARNMLYTIVALGILESIIGRLVGGKDNDKENRYDKKPQYVKDKNLILMLTPEFRESLKNVPLIGNGLTADSLMIPLGYGINFFKFLGNKIGDYIDYGLIGNKRSVNPAADAIEIIGSFVGAFVPFDIGSDLYRSALPTVGLPGYELGVNSDYRGAPIMPKDNPYDKSPPPDSERFFRSVSPLSKRIAHEWNSITGGTNISPGTIGGKEVSISPETMDYMWDFATGGLGKFINNTVSTGYKLAVNPGDFTLQGTPIVRRFVGSSDEDHYRTNTFYDRLSQVDYAKQEKKAKNKQYAEDTYPVASHMQSSAMLASKFIKEKQKLIKKIEADIGHKLPSNKQQRIDAAQRSIDKHMDDFNRKWNDREDEIKLNKNKSVKDHGKSLSMTVGPIIDGKSRIDAIHELHDSGMPAMASLLSSLPINARRDMMSFYQREAYV